MFQRCLICTNFADGLYRLVEFVPSLAANGIQTIIFLHSVPLWEEGEIPRIDEQGIVQARDRLQAGLKNIPEDVEVHIEVLSGRPLDTIPKVAKNYDVDVIFTGMESRNFLQEKLFGSTTAGLARNYTTPLMILRPQLVSTYTCEELALRCQHLFRYFLIPYNGGKASEYLLQKVKAYAQKRPDHSLCECLLIWVIEEWRRKPVSQEQQVQVAQEKLKQIKADLEGLGLQVQTEVRIGNPYLEVLDAATVFDISAIAVSSETIGSIIELPVRSFAGELMRRSWHPVLFFPPPS